MLKCYPPVQVCSFLKSQALKKLYRKKMISLTGVGHNAEVSLFVVVQQLVHIEDRVFLIGYVEPGGHDRSPGQHHPPPLLLWTLLRLKHVLHCFTYHSVC